MSRVIWSAEHGLDRAAWDEIVPLQPSIPADHPSRHPHAFDPDMSGDMSQFCRVCACTREIGQHMEVTR